MVAPRFLDTFEPHPSVFQAAGNRGSGDPRVGMLTSDLASVAGTRDTRMNVEQTKAFTYWNYVAISAICDKASQQFPQLGVSRRSGTTGQAQRLTQSQRDHLRQNYGMLGAANEDFEPLAETHPLVQVLRDVNPWDTWCEFLYETVMFLELTGEFFWWIIPNGLGLPVELYVVPTQWVHEQRDRNGQLVSYRIIPDGDYSRTEEVEPEFMVHAKLKNPRSKTRGFSSLQAAPLWPDNVLNIEQSRWFGFKNGVNPDLVVTLDGDQYKNPDEAVLDRIREKFIRRAAGVKKAGEPLLLPPGVAVEPWSRSNQEMGFVESSDQVRDNNLALHRTPKTIAGITAEVNRASFEGSMVAFCEMKINPRLRFIAAVIQEHVASRFDPRILVWFEDTTPRNAEQELKETELDARVGAITPDERRQERGREPMGMPAYETGWLPAGLQPLNEDLRPDPNEDPAPAPAPDGAQDDPVPEDNTDDAE